MKTIAEIKEKREELAFTMQDHYAKAKACIDNMRTAENAAELQHFGRLSTESIDIATRSALELGILDWVLESNGGG